MLRIFAATALIVVALGCSETPPGQSFPPPTNELRGVYVPFTTTQPPPVQEYELEASTTTTTPPPWTPPPSTGEPATDCWASLAASIGWPPETLGTLTAIIRRESGCNPTAYADRPSTLDNSRGLLQINAYGNLGDNIRRLCGVDPSQLFDPATNLRCGLAYYNAAGWTPWRLD